MQLTELFQEVFELTTLTQRTGSSLARTKISDSDTAGKGRFPHLNKLSGDTSYSLDLEEENMTEKKLFFKELDLKIIVDNYWLIMVWEEVRITSCILKLSNTETNIVSILQIRKLALRD